MFHDGGFEDKYWSGPAAGATSPSGVMLSLSSAVPGLGAGNGFSDYGMAVGCGLPDGWVPRLPAEQPSRTVGLAPVLELAVALGSQDEAPPPQSAPQHGACDGNVGLGAGGESAGTASAGTAYDWTWHAERSGHTTDSRDEPMHHGDEEPRTRAAKAASTLRQLLDFYFESFNLQHNRYLLDLIARQMGPPAKAGPWSAETLADFAFSFDDLSGLGRITAALAKLRFAPELTHGWALGRLKHLQRGNEGQWLLRVPPEVRSFVKAKSAPHETVTHMVQFLTGMREARGPAPSGMVSVLSYSLADVMLDDSKQGQQRRQRLKRQLSLHHTDVMCLQGLDPQTVNGLALATSLNEDGYGFTSARQGGDANSIFWDLTRWQAVGREVRLGSALAVDLQPLDGAAETLRVVCVRPDVRSLCHESYGQVFGGRELGGGPLVVCADFTLLGGAEAASAVHEVSGLPSAMLEVLGEELLAPLAEEVAGRGVFPARSGASGLNLLRRPDAVLYRGMWPVAALSGHTEHYLTTLGEEELVQQFPAFHVPVVAAFSRAEWNESSGASA